MNWGALLAFAALAASATEPVADWRSRLAEAETALADDGSGCPRGVTAEAVLADYAAGRLPRLASEDLDSRRDDLRLLFSCRALAPLISSGAYKKASEQPAP